MCAFCHGVMGVAVFVMYLQVVVRVEEEGKG